MRSITVTVGPLAAASANAIALSQTPTSGTALTLNGALVSSGVAVMDKPRRVLLTYGSEASNRTLVVTGTGYPVANSSTGPVISETLAVPSGGAGTVSTVQDFATVTSLVPAGGGWTAAVTVGTSSVASSRPVFLDTYGWPNTILQVAVSGTVNYTVQQSTDDPNVVGFTNMTWFSHPDSAFVAATAGAQSNYFFTPTVSRVTLNSGTGTITYTLIQSGGSGR